MTRLQILGASRLTPRQIAVLTGMAHGNDRAEVARQLHYSESTVAAYLKEARTRLQARNTTHAVAIAIAAGVVRLDGDGS